MPQQLSFNLPAITALGREDFFVSPANAGAVAMVEAWEEWPARKLALIGPASSGKTHLAHVWATLANAQIISAASLARADIPTLAAGNVAVEDAAGIAGIAKAEAALFHLHNLTLAEGNSLLLTASRPPNFWQLSLPDLASRMSATPIATLEAPDDSLLSAVLIKLFTDRQLSPTPETIPYLTRRIDRSLIAARQIVERLDAASLETGRPINRALAAGVLDKPAH
ncbi:DnaA inactivator Hda (shorter homolog of DnaA) [hydrothermal vent metagenome]|uniref:DnaA inactivator Hda (Shorter homolog of DnaA) n=1 Tax=hydrothermal vent metagenome TaxID=652676 RepID=A0A3B0SZA5_9ZZZZ